MHPLLKVAAAAAVLAGATASARADDLTVALIYGRTGPLEAYAKQTETGLRLGFEYATKGTMTIDGRKINIIVKDDQSKPDLAKSALAEAYEDDHADIAIGTHLVGGGDRHAAGRRGAQEDPDRRAGGGRPDHRRQMEPLHLPHRPQLVAGRDLQRGGDRQAGRPYRDAGAGLRVRPRRRRRVQGGARQDRRQLSTTRNTRPPTPTDFTAVAQRLFDALKDKPGRKIIWVLWAGGGDPMDKLQDLDPGRYGIELSTGGNIFAALCRL